MLSKLFPFLNENSLFARRNLLKNGDAYDKLLLFVLLGLLCLGLVMVFSASATQGAFENRYYFFHKQCYFAVGGFVVAAFAFRVPLWRWQRWGGLLLLISCALLLWVSIFGASVNGATRWMNIPFGLKFQPSEFLKLSIVLYMADFLKRKTVQLHDFKRILFVTIPVGISVACVLLTRDLGSVLVVAAIFVAMLFLVNMPLKWVFSVLLTAVMIGVAIIVTSEFRIRRVQVMWQPWNDPTGTGFQGLGALMSINRGGLLGEGLGKAIFKQGFLPEAHTDFIFAVIGEEMGLLFLAFLVAVYFWIVWRAFSIGKQARDLDLHFNAFVAFGIGILVAAQSFVNIGVNISLLPNKGLTLPLISYGGSSLLMMMVAFALLLRVDYETRRVLCGFSVVDPNEQIAKPVEYTDMGGGNR